jgi:hypothetical protein
MLMWHLTEDVKICEDFALKFVAILTSSHFSLGISSTNSNMNVIPHPPNSRDLQYCSVSVLPTEDNTSVTQVRWLGRFAGSAEHPHRTWLQDVFKKLQKHWGQYYMKGTTLRVMVASRPPVFCQMAVPVLEIMVNSGT